MARRCIEGGELGALGPDWVATGVDVSSSSIPASFSGTYYLQFVNTFDRIIHDLGSGIPTIFGAWSDKDTVVSAWCVLAQFKDSAGTAILSILRYTSGVNRVIEARLGAAAGTALATSSEFPQYEESRIEFKYTPLNSGGLIQVKRNGVLIINYSGDTTAGLENVRYVVFGTDENWNTGFYADDIVLDDANWIGNTRIQKLQISGAGSAGEWDASTGSPYQCVDEIPYSDTDYISTNVSGESATFACADLTGNIAEIKSLAVYARMAYEGNPTPTKQKIAIRVNGTEYYGSDVSPTPSFANYLKLWELNPDDSQAWEAADINAIEIGVRSVS